MNAIGSSEYYVVEFGLLVLASSGFVAIVAYVKYEIIIPLRAMNIMLNMYRRGEGKFNTKNYI